MMRERVQRECSGRTSRERSSPHGTHDGHGIDQLRPVRSTATTPRSAGVGSGDDRSDQGALHRVGGRRGHPGCAARATDGSPRNTRCCPVRRRSESPGRPPGASSRGGPTRSSGSSGAHCGPSATWSRSASARSSSTATCCRPTAVRGTAAITGAYVALQTRCTRLVDAGTVSHAHPLTDTVAAVSVGIVDGVHARPALCRGLAGRGRYERRHDRRRALRRGAGDRGGMAVQPWRARRSAGARRRGHRRARDAAGRRARRAPPRR